MVWVDPGTQVTANACTASVYGTKAMSVITAPTENGEPLMAVSAPVVWSNANPTICLVAMLIYTNFPPGSTAMDEGCAPSGIDVPLTGVKLPDESIPYAETLLSPVLPTNTNFALGDVPASIGGATATKPGCRPLANGDPDTGVCRPVVASTGNTAKLFVSLVGYNHKFIVWGNCYALRIASFSTRSRAGYKSYCTGRGVGRHSGDLTT